MELQPQESWCLASITGSGIIAKAEVPDGRGWQVVEAGAEEVEEGGWWDDEEVGWGDVVKVG